MKKSLEIATQNVLEFDSSLKETLLIAAVRDNKLEALKELLSSENDITTVQSYTCGTPLVAAAFFGHLEAFKILLDNEPKPFDASRHPGLLLTAIRNDQPEMIKLLLENSTPINETGEKNYQKPPSWFDAESSTPFDNYGPPVFELPIIVAIQDKKLRALSVLIKYKPDFDKAGTLGYNARSLINSENTSPEMIKILNEEGIINKKGTPDKNAFFSYSCINSPTKEQETPINLEVQKRLEELKKWLTSLENQEREYVMGELSELARGLTVVAK